MTLAFQPDPDLDSPRSLELVSGRRVAGVRPEIARSWERSARSGVRRDAVALPGRLGGDRPHRLLRAAGAVVERLARRLHGQHLAVVLADADARVIDVRTGQPGVLAWLDRLGVVPGALLAEEAVGTNAIGSAVEERRPFAVVGAEHYRENLRRLSARAVPVRHPVTGVVKGALALACRTEDDSVLLLPLVEEAAAGIEAALADDATRHERLLLDRFLQTTRRSAAAVVCLNRDLLISNTLAGPLVSPADQPFLWDWATRVLAGRDEYCGELRLAEDVVVQARCAVVRDDDQEAGVLIEMRPRATAPPCAPRGDQRRRPGARGGAGAGAVPGRSAAAERVRRELAAVAGDRSPVLISGEPGTGKTFLARHLHERDGAVGEVTVLETAQCRDDPAAWFARLRAGLLVPGTVVLQHIDELPGDLAWRAVGLVEGADVQAVRLVATARPGGSQDATTRLRDCFPARLQLPPLRQRTEDVADIAQVLVRGVAGSSPAPRLEPATLQSLTGQVWPGNVRELRAVLSSALLRSAGRDVALKHLPPEYRTAPIRHRLTSLQRAEREALLNALDDSGGNKLAAAELLGIARSTLYRKIRILGIDGRCLSG